VPYFILDSSYSPTWEDFKCKGSCRKGGAAIVFLIFLFVSLPVWLKALATGSAISEVLARWTAYVVWTFDRRPDFAIGPYGIYGLSGLKYHHIAWPDISGAVHRRTRTLFGTRRSLRFNTKVKREKSWLLFGRKPSDVSIVLAPVHGFDLDEIRMLTGRFAPEVRIDEVAADTRPWLFRW
jgi:hypothetical protein